MTTEVKEETNQEFQPVEQETETKEKPESKEETKGKHEKGTKKKAKTKKRKLSQQDKLMAFEMFYDLGSLYNVEILNKIAEKFNTTGEIINKLYIDEQWYLKAETRDYAFALHHERKNAKNRAEIKKNLTDFVLNEFNKIMKEYETKKESYFKTPEQLLKALKLATDINKFDFEDFNKGLHALTDKNEQINYPVETSSRQFRRHDYIKNYKEKKIE